MTMKEGGQWNSRQIIEGLRLNSSHMPIETRHPLPMPELHRLPRDRSMLYGLGRVDSSGRVVNQAIIAAMNWQPGHRADVIAVSQAIVILSSPHGLVRVPQRPCIVIPAAVRHQRGISDGDHLLLAAAPGDGVIIVHTLADLDEMLSEYHASRHERNCP